MFKNINIGIIFLPAVICVAGWTGTPQKKEGVLEVVESPAHYLSEWKEFLSVFKEGDSIDQLRRKLPSSTRQLGFIALGGSGGRIWVFRVDDFSDLFVTTDRDDKLVKSATAFKASVKWRCFPSGRLE